MEDTTTDIPAEPPRAADAMEIITPALDALGALAIELERVGRLLRDVKFDLGGLMLHMTAHEPVRTPEPRPEIEEGETDEAAE